MVNRWNGRCGLLWPLVSHLLLQGHPPGWIKLWFNLYTRWLFTAPCRKHTINDVASDQTSTQSQKPVMLLKSWSYLERTQCTGGSCRCNSINAVHTGRKRKVIQTREYCGTLQRVPDMLFKCKIFLSVYIWHSKFLPEKDLYLTILHFRVLVECR